MTQIRPRIPDGLAAQVQEYADSYGISFNAAVKILLRIGLACATPASQPGSTP